MNRLLAEILSALNAMLALSIIACGAGAGLLFPPQWWPGSPLVFAVVGGLAGLVAAAVICGLIAFLSLIERHLREIAEGTTGVAHPIRREERREPTV